MSEPRSTKPVNAALVLVAADPQRPAPPLEQLVATLESVEGAGLAPVVVVLGIAHTPLKTHIEARPERSLLVDTSPQPSMGTSIALGVSHIAETGVTIDSVLLALADQPPGTAQELLRLRRALVERGADIAATRAAGSVGPPAIFGRRCVPSLAKLDSVLGTRRLLTDASFRIVHVAVDTSK